MKVREFIYLKFLCLSKIGCYEQELYRIREEYDVMKLQLGENAEMCQLAKLQLQKHEASIEGGK